MSDDPNELWRITNTLIDYKSKRERERFCLSVSDLLELDREIERLEKLEHTLMYGPEVSNKESPEERSHRYMSLLEEEQQKKPRGAQSRAAKRAGITRQTFSDIVKRKTPAK